MVVVFTSRIWAQNMANTASDSASGSTSSCDPKTLPPWVMVALLILLPICWISSLNGALKRDAQSKDQQPVIYNAIFESPPIKSVHFVEYGTVINSRFWFEFTSDTAPVLRHPGTYRHIDPNSEHARRFMYQGHPWITDTLWRQGTNPSMGTSELWICTDPKRSHYYVFGYYPIVP